MSEKKKDSGIIFMILAAIIIIAVLIGVPAYNKIKANAIIEENKYNGFDFVRLEQGNLTTWKTVVDSQGELYELQFYHHPQELLNISIDPTIATQIINVRSRPQRVYFTLPDSQDGSTLVVAAVEMSKILGYQLDLFNIDVKSAMQGNPANNIQDVSVVDCVQATENATVISFHQGSFNVVVRDEENPYCIRFGYKTPRDAIKVADRLAYELLEIMP